MEVFYSCLLWYTLKVFCQDTKADRSMLAIDIVSIWRGSYIRYGKESYCLYNIDSTTNYFYNTTSVISICTLQHLYNTVRCNTVWDITRFKDGSQKMYRLY